MKNLRKIGSLLLVACFLFTGCGSKSGKNIEGNLSDIMNKVYAGVDEEMPEFQQTELTDDNIEYFLGTKDIDYKEGLASEPLINAMAHSVVLVRMNEGADIEEAKEKIKSSVNPRKWVCVEVDSKDVIVDSKGDMIILIMVNDYSKDFQKSFQTIE
ncbi:MAG: hypothetical protein HFI86_02345 [Bacilli bacterium]|nr:hypothetical protein [Bacilli bacterium]MCI9434103.1 hypothetical protein [Bacilli bacterium]